MTAMCPRKGDSMRKPRGGTGGHLLSIFEHHIFSVHTVILKGIAVFFCSTYSLPIPISPPICPKFFKTSASALRRVRFFVVGKSLFLTFYQSRAPPSSLELSVFKNFKTADMYEVPAVEIPYEADEETGEVASISDGTETVEPVDEGRQQTFSAES